MMIQACQTGLPGADLPLDRVCALLTVNRGSYYRDRAGLQPTASASLAVAQYRRAVTIDPADETAAVELANLLISENRTPEAIEVLHGIADSSPGAVNAKRLLGALLI